MFNTMKALLVAAAVAVGFMAPPSEASVGDAANDAKVSKYVTVPAGAGLLALAGNASAQNFDGILAGLDGATAVTAIVAAAAILALVGFAAWGARKVGKFFG